MKEIIAIGGGEIGRSGTFIETLEIDKRIIASTGKVNPRVCFVPTASHDCEEYIDVFYRYYGRKLGCFVTTLEFYNKEYKYEELYDVIMHTDIVYVGGGNTAAMLKKWKENGFYELLRAAYRDLDIILCGLSAGAICWFKYGSSDSLKFDDTDTDYIQIEGFDFINATACPHYDVEPGRIKSLKQFIKENGTIGLGIENCAAIRFFKDNYEIITSKNNAGVWVTSWKDGVHQQKKLVDSIRGKINQLV